MADLIPDPSVYLGETAQALQAYQNAVSSISARRAATLQNYGFTAQVDPNTGALSGYSIDPNNQYGQVQGLLGNEGTALHTAYQNAGVRGIGHLGLGAQDSTLARNQYGGLAAQLGSQFTGEIGQEASDQVMATQGYDAAKVQAQRDALTQALMNGLFTPVATQAIGGPGDSGSGPITDAFTKTTSGETQFTPQQLAYIRNLPVNRARSGLANPIVNGRAASAGLVRGVGGAI